MAFEELRGTNRVLVVVEIVTNALSGDVESMRKRELQRQNGRKGLEGSWVTRGRQLISDMSS